MSLDTLATNSRSFEATEAAHSAARQQAEHVVARMLAVGENIAHLLLQLAQAQADVRDVVTRLGRLQVQQKADEARQTLRQATTSAEAQAAGLLTQGNAAAEISALKSELTQLGLRARAIEEQLQAAVTELQALQTETLPTAQMADLVQDHARAQAQRERLTQDIEHYKQELKDLNAAAHAAAQWQQRLRVPPQQVAATLRMQPSATTLLSSASAEPIAATPQATAAVPQALPKGADAAELRVVLQELAPLLQLAKQAGNGEVAAPLQGLTAWSSGTPQKPMSPAVAALQQRWAGYVAKQHAAVGGMDVNEHIQWVMREAYLANSEDLAFYAHRVQFYTELKKRLRAELGEARQFLSDHINTKDPKKLTAPYRKKRFSTVPMADDEGNLQPRPPEDDGLASDVQQLEEYIKALDNQLNTLGDDSQMAQLELQHMTQRQQQTLQTLSNLSKVFHETGMSIIRKIGS